VAGWGSRPRVVAVIVATLVSGCSSGETSLLEARLALPETLEVAALVRRVPTREGTAPPRVALLLHGSGSSAEKFLDVADEISRHGFAALVVRAPRELSPGRYGWSSSAETHALLGRILELAEREMPLARERPILVGYSLGATIAVQLLAEHPEAYAGAYAISPGPIARDHLAPASVRRPLVILVGEQDAPSAAAVERIEQAWSEAKEPYWVDHHPGDHQPPVDWRDHFDDAMTWMTVKADL
jgi:predicted esterase